MVIDGRQENLGIRKKSGIAKVVGTMLCVGGAILLSFYHGQVIGIGQSSIHWGYAEKLQSGGDNSGSSSTSLLGPVLLILSALVWSLWFIIQVSIFSLNIILLYLCLCQWFIRKDTFVVNFRRTWARIFQCHIQAQPTCVFWPASSVCS